MTFLGISDFLGKLASLHAQEEQLTFFFPNFVLNIPVTCQEIILIHKHRHLLMCYF